MGTKNYLGKQHYLAIMNNLLESELVQIKDNQYIMIKFCTPTHCATQLNDNAALISQIGFKLHHEHIKTMFRKINQQLILDAASSGVAITEVDKLKQELKTVREISDTYYKEIQELKRTLKTYKVALKNIRNFTQGLSDE